MHRQRNLVPRPDGKLVNVARPRGHLFVCANGCCCGNTTEGFAPVPGDRFHQEWESRRLRNVVHLTIGGCLGPCALANVAMLVFDGQVQWFHSMNDEAQVIALYDHIEQMLDADAVLPPADLASRHFSGSRWQPRPDGQPVDDARPWRRRSAASVPTPAEATLATTVERLVADMPGATAIPRKNGELVFDEPWQGRVFGLAVALHQAGHYDWNEFRDELIASVAAAEQSDEPFRYYDVWLIAFERLLVRRGIVSGDEIDETTFQFEYGERDDVF